MNRMLDKFITGFFVGSLAIIWYFSTRCYVSPSQHTVKIYDSSGIETSLDEVRTQFKTKQVAFSFAKEYKNQFPQYDFVVGEEIPKTQLRLVCKGLGF
ncbi:MAG: hypothetical protein KC483_06285 [Nitrosarchaeum sp.]|nr:hypothetical protein [Nitrosarchaeum sp.]